MPKSPPPPRREGDVRLQGTRPGAMTRAMDAVAREPEPGRVLRAAVLRGGRIEAERRVRRSLRVGDGEGADLPLLGLRGAHELFRWEAGAWRLVLPAGATARVGDGTGRREELRGERVLGARDRGRVRLPGGEAVLFQLVGLEEEAPAPGLPAPLRRGLLGHVDAAFTATLAAAFVLCFGGLVALEGADWPVRTAIVDDGQLARLVFEEPLPPPAPAATWARRAAPEPESPASPERTEVAPAPTTPSPSRGRLGSDARPTRPDAAPSLDPDAAPEAAIERVEQLLLGRIGEGGSALDRLMEGARTGSLTEALEEVPAGPTVASARADRLRERDTRGSGESFGPTCCDSTEPGRRDEIATGPLEEREVPPGDVVIEDGWDEAGDFDPALLTRRVRALRRRLTHCYENQLAHHPGLQGRVEVELRVMPAGNVVAHVRRNSTGNLPLEGCLERTLSSIRFREPPDRPAVFAWPFIFQRQ